MKHKLIVSLLVEVEAHDPPRRTPQLMALDYARNLLPAEISGSEGTVRLVRPYSARVMKPRRPR